MAPVATGTESRADPAGDPTAGFTTASGRFIPYNLEEPSGPPKTGGTMRFRYTFDPGQLDPTVSAAGGTLTACNIVYERLVGVYGGPDADPYQINNLQPELSSAWESTPDGLTYSFAIQDGITWQNLAPLNGRAFVAEDAAFALRRYQNEGVHTQYFTQVESIEAPDDGTVIITLRQPQPDFIYALSTSYTTIHPRELVDDGSIASRAIGTGPMLLDRWEPTVGGAFNRNPDYWQGPIPVDRWELPYILDEAAALAGFRAEQYDFGLGASSEQDLEAVISTNPDIQYFSSPAFSATFSLAFNLDLPMWTDERVRQAISLAVDRETLSSVIYGSFGRVAAITDWRFFWDEQPTAESGVLGQWWRHDPTEARSLLQAAGAENFAFELIYYNYGDSSNRRPNEILVDQLRSAGINMRAVSVDYTQFNSQWTTRQGDAHAYDGWLAFNPTAQHYVFGLHHSSSPGNRYRINDPEIDEWAEQHLVELDEPTRKELAQRVWTKVYDQVYRVDKPLGVAVNLQQPWVRGLRSARGIGSGQHYLDTANFARHMWIDR